MQRFIALVIGYYYDSDKVTFDIKNKIYNSETEAFDEVLRLANAEAQNLNNNYSDKTISPFEVDDEGLWFNDNTVNVVFNDDGDYKLVTGYRILRV